MRNVCESKLVAMLHDIHVYRFLKQKKKVLFCCQLLLFFFFLNQILLLYLFVLIWRTPCVKWKNFLISFKVFQNYRCVTQLLCINIQRFY